MIVGFAWLTNKIRHIERNYLSKLYSKSCKGFTLLEVIFALLILALGIASIIPLFTVGATSHKRGVDQTIVSFSAQNIVSELQSVLNTLNPQDIQNKTITGYGATYTYDANFQIIDRERNAFLVKITVKWHTRGKENSEKFETILLRKVKF